MMRGMRPAFWLVLLLAPALARGDDVLHLGSVQLDRPTLVTLGLRLLVSGQTGRDKAHVAQPLGGGDAAAIVDEGRI